MMRDMDQFNTIKVNWGKIMFLLSRRAGMDVEIAFCLKLSIIALGHYRQKAVSIVLLY